ncbi:MAG: radical SAM protein [Chitinivibrionales bacterium]
MKLSPRLIKERNCIEEKRFGGEFWKPCPGTTRGYLCCGYQILTPVTGCGMYCTYCVLQAYFNHRHQLHYTNIDDMETEIRRKMADHHRVVRFGTGEFADSLYLEPTLGISGKVASILEPYPNVLVEFKTKSTFVHSLSSVEKKHKVVIGFSINTPRMIEALEAGTSPLHKRLEAARWCVEQGFWVAFHFDPMVWYPQWETDYRAVVNSIFDTVEDASRIAWWSIGAFRSMPELKTLLKKRSLHLPLFSGELVLGEDHKYRYVRPVRVAFYDVIRQEVEKRYPQTTLYLCMESPEVWEESGLLPRIPHGLTAYLDRRAEQMLGLG